MTNQEKQVDEILALQSIFDQNFRLLDDNQYEISIGFDLPSPFSIQYNNQISMIQYLPPFTLIIHYHDDYPSDDPPSFILSCFYFSKIHLQELCQKLDNYSFVKGEVCVYDWINLIKHEIKNELSFHIQSEEQENDPRALNGYRMENVERIFEYLINYNDEYKNKEFVNHLQRCLICADLIRGIDCIRLHRCHHFYCRSCLNNYIQINLQNGLFGDKLLCPENECKQSFLPNEIKQILENDELYQRYERLTLQHSLALMNDILWCPRCQSPVLIDNNKDNNLAMCDQCHYTFCKKCKELFHSQTMCPKDYLIQQLKLQKEKERQRIQKQQEETRKQLAKIEEEKKSSAEQKLAKQKYRHIIIKLSEEDSLLEEILNAERIETLDTQYCPNCHVRIEKNGGCSHMHCSRCDHHFTWKIIEKPEISKSISFLNNSTLDFAQIESVKEELNKTGNIDEDQEEQDSEILIDNRSLIGSAIVNRVKKCPTKSCKKLNVKIDQDNWIVCNQCMKQYCFLCERIIHGIQHFEKKCQRYTTI